LTGLPLNGAVAAPFIFYLEAFFEEDEGNSVISLNIQSQASLSMGWHAQRIGRPQGEENPVTMGVAMQDDEACSSYALGLLGQ
jgi:hypothetical protein